MATRKKPSRKTPSSLARSESPSPALAEYAATNTSSRKIKRSYIIFLVAAIVILILFALRSYFIAAVVNGRPISRLTVVHELEKQGGKQILQSLVSRELILQEAKKRNITLTQDDINKDLAKIEATYKQQGQTLDQVLKTYGVSKEEVIDQRKPWVLLDKMIGKDITVTDKEVTDFIAANNEAYGGTLKPAEVKQSLIEEKLKQKEQEFIQNLQKNAKIDYLVQY